MDKAMAVVACWTAVALASARERVVEVVRQKDAVVVVAQWTAATSAVAGGTTVDEGEKIKGKATTWQMNDDMSWPTFARDWCGDGGKSSDGECEMGKRKKAEEGISEERANAGRHGERVAMEHCL
jgi:hypothetical protein